MVNNIYKHNSRSYYDVYNALVNAYPRKPTWIWNEMAGLFDFGSELMNRIATDILYPVTRESAYAFASRCGYTPVEADGATDTLTITLTSAMTKTLAAGYQVGGQSAATGKMVIYELTTAGSSGGTSTITVAAKQKKTIGTAGTPSTWKLIGTVLNSDDFYDYPIDGYTKIINDSTAQLYIDGTYWTKVNNFDASTGSSTHFMLVYQSSGKVRVRFGDGVNGLKPTVGSSIYATFSVTEGLKGVMEAGEITINVGQDADISSITNAGSTGGNDAESVNSIVRNAIKQTRQKDIVWSEEDLEVAALEASSSVIKAKGYGGVGSASVDIITTGATTPTAALIATVQDYIQSLTQFGKMPVTVSDATYVVASITATVTVSSSPPTGYTSANVLDLVRFALSLSTSAADSQVIDRYDEYGIDDCRASVIAVLYPALTFTATHNDALEIIIKQWKSLLGDTRDYREWGQSGEVGDFWIMGDCLTSYGVDEFNITAIYADGVLTTSNIGVDDDAILNTGTITVS